MPSSIDGRSGIRTTNGSSCSGKVGIDGLRVSVREAAICSLRTFQTFTTGAFASVMSSEGEGGRVPRITEEFGVVEFELDLEKEVETVDVDEALLVVARCTSFGERIFWALLARSA